MLFYSIKSWILIPTRNSPTNFYNAKLRYRLTADSPTAGVTKLKLAFYIGSYSGVSYKFSTLHSYFHFCLPFQSCHHA